MGGGLTTGEFLFEIGEKGLNFGVASYSFAVGGIIGYAGGFCVYGVIAWANAITRKLGGNIQCVALCAVTGSLAAAVKPVLDVPILSDSRKIHPNSCTLPKIFCEHDNIDL